MNRALGQRCGLPDLVSRTTTGRRLSPAVLLVCLAMTACAGPPDRVGPGRSDSGPRRAIVSAPSGHPDRIARGRADGSGPGIARRRDRRRAELHPRILTPKRPLQCVPYARRLSQVAIRGDAWTWWRAAAGRYQRDAAPRVGSVLVLRGKGASRGHLAVVTDIVNAREIVVSHANWLNRGRIHLDTPVRDVSAANDWSAVRVWYTPGRRYGAGTYPAHGFIHPNVSTAAR